MSSEKFSIEFEAVQDYIDTRTQVIEGGGGGGGGTMNHSELEQLDYESSGHTGFASTEYVDSELMALANTMNNQVGSIEAILGTPKDGTIAQDIENLDTKLQEVLDKFMPQPDAPDPEVPEWIPEYYVLATDEDFSGTANGSFKYIGTDEYVIVPYRIKGVIVRSYRGMFKGSVVGGSSIKGVASYSKEVLDFSQCFMYASTTGQNLELNYLNTSGAYVFTEMFKECKAGTLDLSWWDTSNVYLMDYVFQSCKATSIDISGWNTKKVSTFYYCFAAPSVKSLVGLGDLTNENCSNYGYMFATCGVVVLDLGGFTTPLTGTLSNMLQSTSYVLEAYAKTQADADWLNSASISKPSSYTFTVKEE